MEGLVKRRTPVRASFTRNYNAIITLLNEVEPIRVDVESKYTSLERVAVELTKLDEEISELLLQEEGKTDDFEEEYAKSEEYRDKLDYIRVRVQSYLKACDTKNESFLAVSEKRKLKLPKIELVKFGGDVKDWLNFWSQFKRIHENADLEKEDKFQYLIQCMVSGSRAREVVDSYPPTAENYSKCIDSLQTRFGREELLVEFYVRELLSLVIKNVTNSKCKGNIVQLYDKLESHLRSLESIGMTSDRYAAMLFPLVESCIPEETLRVWIRNPIINEDNSYGKKLTQLLLFLRAEVEGEERISLAKAGFKQSEVLNKRQKSREIENSNPTATDLLSGAKTIPKRVCLFCGKSHDTRDCFKAKNFSFSEKMELLRKNKACFVCLRIGHRSNSCRADIRCFICSKKHCTIMCPGVETKSSVPDISNANQDVVLYSHSQPQVLLQTVIVSVETQGKRRVLRALIDSGSQRSYLLKATVGRMGLVTKQTENLTHIVFGGKVSQQEHKCYDICLRNLHDDYSCKIQVLDQPNICGTIPRVTLKSVISELHENGIKLSDVGNEPAEIELLIGADYAGKLYTGNILNLKEGYVAVETYLGWVVMGKSSDNRKLSNTTSLLIQSGNICDLWKLEAIGIMDPCERQSQQEVERTAVEYFRKTVTRDLEGRYVVKLPWMHGPEELSNNREAVGRRLSTNTTKLVKGNNFSEYDSVLQDWLKEGIVEETTEGPGHYLPHRGVFKENSTTSVRPVFDASCKSRGTLSLNDCLIKGPNLLELIPTLLLRFRQKKIGVTSDIKKAFLQISIAEEDREFLKFLWWKDKERKFTKVLQHCRVVFGLNCSPFLLGAVIQHHLSQYTSSPLEDIAMKLNMSFYVDNCVTSVDSEEELQDFIKSATEMMAEAKFELRLWEFTDKINLDNTCMPSSVLGIQWNRFEDSLSCDTRSIEVPSGPVTRRVILSLTQRLFDPLGFVSPITLCPKLLLQESWQKKMSWDAEVSEFVRKKFLKWIEDLKLLSMMKIPRRIFLTEDARITLHVFCDASAVSFAAAVFLRCATEYEVCVQLVMSKSRIAPLREVSIPRLELLACVVGARLYDFVKKSLMMDEVQTVFWTDSSTALQWIKRDEMWSVFVRNRVKEIRKLSHSDNWRHIPGQFNPADLPSRGCSVQKLLESRWWEGPPWLKEREEMWPKSTSSVSEEEISQEKLKNINTLLCDSPKVDFDFRRLSSFAKTVRVMGWVQRFVYNARCQGTERRKGELSVFELHKAEKLIFQKIQKEYLGEDYLKGLKTMNILRDEEGIVRIKTKITERIDSRDFRYPILLPGKHRLVELLIREEHLQSLHAGVQIVLSRLRERFWIIGGRRTVRKVVHDCVKCKRHSARSLETMPICLPQDRVKDASVFEIIGVDLAGTLYLKGGEKCWIVLYTCAVYRALHLELVLSLSTKAFILSLRRFISRRGRPKIIYSDNGKNFVGTENLLQRLDWDSIQRETSMYRMTWKFIPPSAPWWGGFWERMVRMVKQLLRRVLGNACLLYEELVSILCDCESVINSRPLTYLSEDPDDLVPLTPSMFLQDNPMVGVTDLDRLDQTDLNKRWKYQQTLRENLRQRFRREYLGILLQSGTKGNYREIKCGDIVLVENDSQKRILWPMARVCEVYPSKDAKIRVARVKTANGEILRPVRKLYPLEISPPENSLPPVETIETPTCDPQADDYTEPPSEHTSNDIKTVTTRAGRIVKLPARFLNNLYL